MGNGVEVFDGFTVSDPKALLAGGLKAGIVAFALGSQGIDGLKSDGAPIDGEPVVVGDGDVFGAAPVFLAVIPIFMVTRTRIGFGVFVRATEFLSGFSVFAEFTVAPHSQARVANGVAHGQWLWIFGISWINGNKTVALILLPDGVVNCFDVKSLVADERTLLDGNKFIRFLQNLKGDRAVGHIRRGGHFVNRQACNAVAEHMVFVAPIEFMFFLVMLV